MDKLKKIDTRENIKTVTSNNFITAKGLEKLSLKARKMLYMAISQCRKDDKEFYTYEISVTEFAQLMNVDESNIYKEADKITNELMAGFIQYKEESNKYFKKYQLFDTCEYNDGIIKFELNKQMTKFLLDLQKDFSQPLLNDFLKMNSPYSMAIWHLMQREMESHKPNTTDKIQFDLSLEEIRIVTGTENKFKQVGQLKQYVFDKALREIDDNCGVKISYENIKKGRTVVGFHCIASSPFHIDESEIPQNIKDRTRLGKLRINSKRGELTIEEQEEYNQLTKKFQQIELKF